MGQMAMVVMVPGLMQRVLWVRSVVQVGPQEDRAQLLSTIILAVAVVVADRRAQVAVVIRLTAAVAAKAVGVAAPARAKA